MFPRGKIDNNENEIDCAIRETFEETGFDPTQFINKDNFIEKKVNCKKIKLFIVTNIPKNFIFSSSNHFEISKVQYFNLNNLPKNTFCVLPYLDDLKLWINNNRNIISDSVSLNNSYNSNKDFKDIHHEEYKKENYELLAKINKNNIHKICPLFIDYLINNTLPIIGERKILLD